MPTVTVSSKGQIVMPKEVRDALGIKPMQKIFLKVVDGHAEITPLPRDPVEGFCGVFAKGTSLAAALLGQRRRDQRLEEKKTA